jgi:SP family xylose:H+ symportor-like MFS transporter
MSQRKVLFWSIVTALGGFLFGFDTAVISGAEKAIQQLWQLSAVEHGLPLLVPCSALYSAASPATA